MTDPALASVSTRRWTEHWSARLLVFFGAGALAGVFWVVAVRFVFGKNDDAAMLSIGIVLYLVANLAAFLLTRTRRWGAGALGVVLLTAAFVLTMPITWALTRPTP